MTSLPHAVGSEGHSSSPLLTLGDRSLLDRPLTAILCSARCPGSLILAAFDAANALAAHRIAAVGGFQTPVERELLALLLRAGAPVVRCPATTLVDPDGQPRRRNLPMPERDALAADRLLLASDAPPTARRVTRPLAERRNALVVSLCSRVLVVHATPAGATDRALALAHAAGIPIHTLPDPANTHLTETYAATPFAIEDFLTAPPSPDPPRPSAAGNPLQPPVV